MLPSDSTDPLQVCICWAPFMSFGGKNPPHPQTININTPLLTENVCSCSNLWTLAPEWKGRHAPLTQPNVSWQKKDNHATFTANLLRTDNIHTKRPVMLIIKQPINNSVSGRWKPRQNPAWLDREVPNKFALMCEWVHLLQALQLIHAYLLQSGKRMDGHLEGNSRAAAESDRMLLFL